MDFAFINILKRVAGALADCPDSAIGESETTLVVSIPNKEIKQFLLAVYQTQLANDNNEGKRYV